MVKKIIVTLLLLTGMLSLQAHKAERKSTPVADELSTRIKMVASKALEHQRAT